MAIIGFVRYAFGSVFMIGITPEYLGLWLLYRSASLILPVWMYQWGDDKLYSLYQRLVLFFFETCTGVEIVLYGQTEEILSKKEKVLYLANHQSTVDWIVADMVALRGNSLGHLRYVMKNTLQLIPLYGHYFYAHGCIYVKRGNFSQRKMDNALEYLKTENVNTWLIIFPEGTRYYPGTPKVIEKSVKFAKDNNLEVLKHHLVPKVKGTWLAVEKLHDNFDAIYNVSVFYEGSVDKDGVRQNAPQLIDFLKGKCCKVHIRVDRIPMNEVPNKEEELKVWLHQLFIHKDKLMSPFLDGKAEDRKFLQQKLGGRTHRLNFWSTFSSFLFFASITFPLIYYPMGRQLYLHLLFYGTLGSYGWLMIKSVC